MTTKKLIFGLCGPTEVMRACSSAVGWLRHGVKSRWLYLARLVETLAKGEPSTIALDIDLRSPIPERGAEELEPYRAETELLLKAIKDVSQKRPVVLATSVTTDATGYTISPNVFDGYDFGSGRVTHGYVTLPRDLRQVPLSVPLKNRAEKEDSFAGAITKTRNKDLVVEAEQ